MKDKLSIKEYKEKLASGELIIKNGQLIMGNLIPEYSNMLKKEAETKTKIDNPVDDNYRTIKLIIKGFPYTKNEMGNPYPKQSDRNMVDRIKSGPDAGDVFLFRNKNTGKLDVIQRHYQPAIVTKTSANYEEQIKQQLPFDWKMFTKEVIVEKCFFIFAPLKNFPKKKLRMIINRELVPKTTKPDEDNLWKMIGDALEHAGVYKNDSLIWKKDGLEKKYGLQPGIILRLKGK